MDKVGETMGGRHIWNNRFLRKWNHFFPTPQIRPPMGQFSRGLPMHNLCWLNFLEVCCFLEAHSWPGRS